jgi:Predicted thioesterase
MEIKIGTSMESEMVVEKDDTASSYGSGSLNVLATPGLIALMENAAMRAVMPYLEEGYTTVGTGISMEHISATPIGLRVKARAEVVKAEGRKVSFKVEAFDESGAIGRGTHERYIVEAKRFMEKAGTKRE